MHSADREMADIETSSDDYASRFSGEVGEYFLDVQRKTTLGLLNSFKESTILDIGGGHAQLAPMLVEQGHDVTVTGSDETCKKRLQALLDSSRLKYHTCDMLNLPFENDSFDIVIAFRLLPHVGKWERLVAEMCRVSQKAIIVDYPDVRSLNMFSRMLFEAKKAIEGNTRSFRLFSRKELSREFLRYRFDDAVFKCQFFVPMVVHRMMKSVRLSSALECCFRVSGLTGLFGSPIVLRVTRMVEDDHLQESLS
jgi:2-polyprenyl-3-methyl-5-hydroxy-6-metoxy-1,4-benzoquinol methylase